MGVIEEKKEDIKNSVSLWGQAGTILFGGAMVHRENIILESGKESKYIAYNYPRFCHCFMDAIRYGIPRNTYKGDTFELREAMNKVLGKNCRWRTRIKFATKAWGFGKIERFKFKQPLPDCNGVYIVDMSDM